ncbi:clathrin interactor EPSIN 1-like isoform X2 [Oryza brachyantha]|uniref:clathrin interactor EPSIN 1-like isoform X2 n=1 Tax=Oryza brachyantha TaxID=4533 RepID=UPI0007763766|nr:clathrin interactor EPSIN 1-like isoform X2 [Oryza brachyantha]
MDFRKVLDQTVRDLRREVNLKVLKVPEIEQKVLDATSDEPWGPHGSDLADIARATKRFGECEMIMNVLRQRLGNTGANWRHVYKALAVIEYLLANGTERAVDGIVDNSSQIAKLTRFEYLEPNGKDVGLNVRKKAETVLALLDDREKLQEVREKAAATRDKYFGLSSTGITHKSSAASFGSASYSSGSRYGSTGGSREVGSFKDSYKDTEWRKNNKETRSNYSRNSEGSKEITDSATSYKSKKSERHGRRNQDFSTSHSKSSANLSTTPEAPSSKKWENEDDDDFNPRGSSMSDDFNPRGSSMSATTRSNHLDLFGPNLMDDFVDSSTSTSAATPVPEVDLFADTAFQLADAPLDAATVSHTQDNIDLFAGRLSSANSITSDTQFSVRGSPNKSSEQKSSSIAHPSPSVFDPFQQSFAASFPSNTEFSFSGSTSRSSQGKSPRPQHSSNEVFDPFAVIPLKSFDVSESFETFSSNTASNVTELPWDSSGGPRSSDRRPLEELNFGAFTSNSGSATTSSTESIKMLGQDSMSASKSAAKKETFQVKSGIWADSLSKGLIDLNITSSKKSNLSNVGVVGPLSNGSKDKGPDTTWYMGETMDITGPCQV